MLRERLRDLFWSGSRTESLDHGSGAIDKELGEVPGDVLVALLVRLFGLQELVEITSAVSVDLDL